MSEMPESIFFVPAYRSPSLIYFWRRGAVWSGRYEVGWRNSTTAKYKFSDYVEWPHNN